ncbi:hypothetical protein BCV70DRAFT_198179 [Testicularia cyperi]|uniref:Uncharacterized protein n=1 Tax=Testicularia cyperi TaxID=1882483 RepID=A0A317XVF8_9BASI|nr:hypothetical protein BCV70DRAFT_198179 [Testicularia cyperi]
MSTYCPGGYSYYNGRCRGSTIGYGARVGIGIAIAAVVIIVIALFSVLANRRRRRRLAANNTLPMGYQNNAPNTGYAGGYQGHTVGYSQPSPYGGQPTYSQQPYGPPPGQPPARGDDDAALYAPPPGPPPPAYVPNEERKNASNNA